MADIADAECAICKNVFSDPRALPCCLHTYCLKCIDGLCKGKPPGDEAHCPMCRKAFRIPNGGLQDLPKNFFIDKMLSVRATRLRQKMFTDAEKLSLGIERCREMLEILTKNKRHYIDKQMKLREIARITLEIGRHLMVMEQLKDSLDRTLKTGTACDIVRSASDLHSRVEELLLKCDSVLQTPDDLSHADITHSKLTDDLTDSLGHLSLVSVPTVTESKEPMLVHVVPNSNELCAVTSLGSELFVVWCAVEDFEVSVIKVYDVMTLTLQRCLNIPGIDSETCCLASCGANNCLYVSGYSRLGTDVLHRVDLSGNVAMAKWQVGRFPSCLSVNDSHNVLVVCLGSRLQEYTTHGELVRELILQDVTCLYNALQLSSGQFVVSGQLGNGDCGVHLLTNQGEVVMSCTGTHGGSPLVDDMALDITSSGFIVAGGDFSAHARIIAVDPLLTCARELHLPVDGGLQLVCSIHFDESRDRLYVGGTSLLVFENITGLIENSSR